MEEYVIDFVKDKGFTDDGYEILRYWIKPEADCLKKVDVALN